MIKDVRNSRKQLPKVKEAVALKYDPDKQAAPIIIAAGAGETAEKIISTAEESNVPVHQDSSLAHTLSLLNIGDEIPQELYEVVAEILIFIGTVDRKYGERYERGKK